MATSSKLDANLPKSLDTAHGQCEHGIALYKRASTITLMRCTVGLAVLI